MRRSVLSVLVVIVGLAVMGAMVYAAEKHDAKCAKGQGCCCCMLMKDADVKVDNIDKGVTITITSDKAEQVKAIQEKAAKCEKSCQMAKEGKIEKKGPGAEKNCPMKDASCKVANIDKGITLTVTSDKPEQVKAIQECAAKCSKGGCKMAGSEKTAGCAHSKACPMAKCCAQGGKATTSK